MNMSIDPIRIDFLANHLGLIDTISQWYLEAWGKNTQNVERSKTLLLSRLNTNKLDMCYLCLENSELIGTVSLTKKGIPNNEEFTPCLMHLLVSPKYRCKGYGAKLVNFVKLQAKSFGFDKTYLFTTDKNIHLWYEKLGWDVIKENAAIDLDTRILRTDCEG
ncbi:MAG: GNAT family N-acetyltransferase [Holosporales bacterium]|jgi:N-acetylglutamate synthase-like GNAT family acetyltransferase|nr:GNAT family N-acetyltransferase [Holosporales bacterium]